MGGGGGVNKRGGGGGGGGQRGRLGKPEEEAAAPGARGDSPGQTEPGRLRSNSRWARPPPRGGLPGPGRPGARPPAPGFQLATVLAQVGAARGGARGPWAAGLRAWRAEGPRALWKGNGVACLRLFPCSAVQLAAYRKFVILFTDDLGHISQWSSIMAGSLAGMVSTIVTYPTDLIKTRLIVQNLLEPSYRGILHAFSTIYQQEGFLALYRGVSLTVLGALPFSAGSLLVYMNLEKLWNGPRDRFSPLQNFANVCLAAAVTQTLSFPFDTVKRKMQVRSSLGEWGGRTSGRRSALLCLRWCAFSDPAFTALQCLVAQALSGMAWAVHLHYLPRLAQSVGLKWRQRLVY
ncbi:hypothetical protein GH733_019390 [Mirounga leonina]|nr:hypothetical protein GH733_019390 [Mirounga leonina]